MEDYKEKYENALAKIKQIFDKGSKFVIRREVFESIFPELKESEDEKIRKALLNHLTKMWGNSQDDVCGIHVEDAIAWLEKQGKQDARYKYLEELLAADDIYQMSVNDTMTKEAKEKAAKALSKLCIGKLLGFEKQGEQKTADEFISTISNFHKDVLLAKCLEAFNKELARIKVQLEAEQKPFDYEHATITQKDFAPKQEPKFKVGNWIITKDKNVHKDYSVCKIVEIENNRYHLENGDYLSIDTLEQYDYYLWTIQDAKEGDVVVDKSDGTIGIFESIGHHPDGGSFNDPSYCFLHCRYDDGYFFADFEDGNMMTSDDVIPATQEQRDLLFQKMKEAGYEWNAEKKELKKIHVIDDGKAEMDYCFTKMMAGEKVSPAWSEEDENYLQSAENACEYQYGKNTSTILWLKHLKDRVQPQPKQEWSEEDEKIALSIEQVMNCASLLNLVPEKIEKVRALLKSLKDRVQPQQNPTWSDEDEENLQHCCMAISVDSLHTHEDKQDMEAWLKRLKDRMGG